MIKYSDVKAFWNSPACPLDGMYMDRIYSILKKNGELYVTDGNAEIKFDEFCITHFLTPKGEITWEDVNFSDEVKETKTK